MVEHVGVGDKAVSLDTFDLDAEDTTCDHHANLRVLLQTELAIIRHFIANRVIILLNVANFLRDLVLERTAFQPGALLLRIEDREVIKRFRQNVNILVKNGHFFASFLHDICC